VKIKETLNLLVVARLEYESRRDRAHLITSIRQHVAGTSMCGSSSGGSYCYRLSKVKVQKPNHEADPTANTPRG
jgi:hypothetical protein